MRPTDEQRAAVAAFTTGGSLVLSAGAGSGKTSTLKLCAAATPHRSGTYIAYNRAIAADARSSFPPNVNCSTAHALAFKAVGNRYAHRLNQPRLPARETARILGAHRPLIFGQRILAPNQTARLAMETVAAFCRSTDVEPDRWHVPRVNGVDEPAHLEELRDVVVPMARRAWADLTSVTGELRFQHDHYLKMWQATYPKLPGDFVFLDEAQDADPCIAAVFDAQTHMQRVAVGDANQAIYGWRGATDAMSGFAADHRLSLTRSFRFGPHVADEANRWLELLRADLRLTGHPDLLSVVTDRPDLPADAVLCRTNGEAMAQVIAALAAGMKVALVGGGDGIRRMAEAAVDLKAGVGTSYPELCAFQTWGEVLLYVEEDLAGRDLAVMVKLIDEHGPAAIIQACDRLVDEDAAQLVVSTAHKSKGREWSTVRVGGDFVAPPDDDGIDRGEAMLAYVTVTRSRDILCRGSLAWIDEFVPTLRMLT